MSEAAPKLQQSPMAAREAFYRETLIAAAEDVFARCGFQAARMPEIARKAGLSLGTLYRVFAGKDELYDAVHRTRGEQIRAAAAGQIEPGRPAVINLFQGIRAYIEYFAEHPGYLRMHLSSGTAWALPTGFETTAQMETWQQGLDLMASVLDAAIEQGDVIRDDSRILARSIFALHQVRLAAWMEGDPERKQDKELLIETTLNALARAILTDAGRQRLRQAGLLTGEHV
ncbi:MAG: TetR/AcrR family transcriptional regulator [Candidatus Dadabacteria bacterium]|nr:MAG: TetR/AcrR family transcriptional regulator [Candidatus Dadabacteria bacterium]